MTRAVVLSLVCSVSLAANVGTNADLDPALQRFVSKPQEPATQYRALRTLEGRNERFNLHATVEVMTELGGPGQFTYTIVSERGSDYIRGKLRQLLETEAKVIRAGDPARSALTVDNYELTVGELAEPGVVMLLVKPRRKEVSLIDGVAFITRDDADLLRVEGRLSKNPSFWTSRVHLVRRYDRIAGMRMPVRLDSTAHIRFAGESTLSMVYDYEMVNGLPVGE